LHRGTRAAFTAVLDGTGFSLRTGRYSQAEMNTLNGVSEEEEEYGLGLQQRKDTCTGDYYFGHVGDVPGYGTVALTSTDGSRQVAMAVALPPASPREDFDPRVQEMLNVAVEALNSSC
jgi:hypothetical protein